MAYSSFGLLLLHISDWSSDLSCRCCFLLRRLLWHFYLRLGRVLSRGSWKRRRWSPAFGVFIVRFAFLTLCFLVVCFSLNRSLQTASERDGFLSTSSCSSRAPEFGVSPAVCLLFFGVCSPLHLFLFLLLIALISFFLIAGVSHGRCYGRALHL